tara:strand:- start:339 stop:479 length:141 start_codon:yes stop_codon:yes gene_type:complete
MIKTILIIIISVSIFGILVFSLVRQIMQKKINQFIADEQKKKKRKN